MIDLIIQSRCFCTNLIILKLQIISQFERDIKNTKQKNNPQRRRKKLINWFSNCCTDETLGGAGQQYSIIQYIIVLYSTIPYSTVQYSTIQYITLQYRTMHYSKIQYSTAQYGTIEYSKAQLYSVKKDQCQMR